MRSIACWRRLARSAEVDVAQHPRHLRLGAAARQRLPQSRRAARCWRIARPVSGRWRRSCRRSFSRSQSPVWMDASTRAQCAAIDDALGGADRVAALTGSPACERFTGPQIRKFARPAARRPTQRPRACTWSARSWRRCWPARDAPIDPGDGSGMNLMDLRASRMVAGSARRDGARACGAGCRRFGRHGRSSGRCRRTGRTATRCPAAAIVPWTGDNPSSLIGTGIIHDRVVAVSLGTSDTVFALTTEAGRPVLARVSIADRRLHEPGLLSQRLAGARVGADRVRPRLGRGRGRARASSRATTAG